MPIPKDTAEAAVQLRQLATMVEDGTARITAFSSMRIAMSVDGGDAVDKQVVSLTVEYATPTGKRVVKDRGRKRLPSGGR